MLKLKKAIREYAENQGEKSWIKLHQIIEESYREGLISWHEAHKLVNQYSWN